MKQIKKVILKIDASYGKIYLLILKIIDYVRNMKLFNYIKNFYKQNEFIFFLLKIGAMSGYIYNNYYEALNYNLLFTIYFILILSILRIIIKYLLYKNDGDGKRPVKNLNKLQLFFKNNIRLNKLLTLYFKYFNLGRLLLLTRNKIFKLLRYVRYRFLCLNMLEKGNKFESKTTFFVEKLLVEYIRVVITDIYIPIKQKILFNNMMGILEWRMVLLILIVIFQNLPFVIKYILIIKWIQVFWNFLVYDYANKEIDTLFNKLLQKKGALSALLYRESYILKNLYIEDLDNYDRGLYNNENDNFYSSVNLRYQDIYNFFWTKDVEKLSSFITIFSEYFLLLEYALTRTELKKYGNFCEKELVSYKPIIKLIRKACILITKSSTSSQKLKVEMHVNEGDFCIILNMSEPSYKVNKSICKISTKNYRKKINLTLFKLNKLIETLRYKYTDIESESCDIMCKLTDTRVDRMLNNDFSKNEDLNLYTTVLKKYKLLDK